MRAPEDLHPDDTAMRVMLRDLIVYTRQRAKLSQRKLAPRVGIGQSALAALSPAMNASMSSCFAPMSDTCPLLYGADPDRMPGHKLVGFDLSFSGYSFIC